MNFSLKTFTTFLQTLQIGLKKGDEDANGRGAFALTLLKKWYTKLTQKTT